jgi:hypothetical protein
VTALHEDLHAAERLGLVDLRADLLVGERPAFRILRAAIERAEAAVGDADVRVVDVPVDDVRDRVVRMLLLANAIRRGAELEVQLTNGPVVTAVVDSTMRGVVVVSIASGASGHEIAASQPDPYDIVTVLAEPPVTIAYSALTTLDAKEGTPVLDDDGDLIGLCSQRHGAGDDQPITLIDVTGDRSLGDRRAVATTIAP